MPNQQQVLAILRKGGTYEAAGRQLGIPAGQAYLIATGLPADGSDSLGADDYAREGVQLGGTQSLLGVPHHNPNQPQENRRVLEWVHRRARTDLEAGASE